MTPAKMGLLLLLLSVALAPLWMGWIFSVVWWWMDRRAMLAWAHRVISEERSRWARGGP